MPGVFDSENNFQWSQLEIGHKCLQLVNHSTKTICHHQAMQQLHFQSSGTFLRIALSCSLQLLYIQRSTLSTKSSFGKHWIKDYDRQIASNFQMTRFISFSAGFFINKSYNLFQRFSTSSQRFAQIVSSPVDAVKDIQDNTKLLVGGNVIFILYFI